MMIAGMSPLKIARALNQRDIKCPSEFQRDNGYMKKWNSYGNECFWTDCRIRCMIKDERYTGTMISLKTESKTVKGKRVKKPAESWIRVEDTHEAIVSYDVYMKAVSMLKQQEFRESEKAERNIYHCGSCGRKLRPYGKGKLICHQRRLRQDCECRGVDINKREADNAVLLVIKQQAEIFIEEDKISKQALKRAVPFSVSDEINSLVKTIAAMQKGWMALYEKYADGKMERADFISEKKKYDIEMNEMEIRLRSLKNRQNEQQEKTGETKKVISQALLYINQLELTEDMKERLIDKVIVHPDNRIEICWTFENDFNKSDMCNAFRDEEWYMSV